MMLMKYIIAKKIGVVVFIVADLVGVIMFATGVKKTAIRYLYRINIVYYKSLVISFN